MNENGGHESQRLLIVEDEPQVRARLARLFRRANIDTSLAASAEEALVLAEGETFDAIITDQQLPGMNGVTLLGHLRAPQPGASLILLTGACTPDTRAQLQELGAALITKPWQDAALVDLVLASDRHSIGPRPTPKRAQLQLLLIEDSNADAVHLENMLEGKTGSPFTVARVRTLKQALAVLSTTSPDLVVADLNLPDSTGLATLSALSPLCPTSAIVVNTDLVDPEVARQAVQNGAQECLIKGSLSADALRRAFTHSVERKRAESRLVRLALHDPLTNLANRSLFREGVARAIKESRNGAGNFALLLIDLDRFKFVNDTLGHEAGDELLAEVACRLKSVVRDNDTVARLGGDEFAVLVHPLSDTTDLELLCNRIMTALGREMDLAGTCIKPSSSIGAARYPTSGTDTDALLAAADLAMYEAKKGGSAGYRVHSLSVAARAVRRKAQETELRVAIEHGRLKLHYQPQATLNSEIVAAEALLRWQCSPRNQSFAADFLPVLEDGGLLRELTGALVRTACEDLLHLRAQGTDLQRICINLSTTEFYNPGLIDVLCRTVREVGADCKDVELELTEHTLEKNISKAEELLKALKNCGFRLALDDFGAGSGSLSTLDKLPMDALHLSRSYMKAAQTGRHARDVAGSIIQLGRRRGLSVVAEGVETRLQLTFLRKERCDLFQGYLLGPAVKRDALAALKPINQPPQPWRELHVS